MGGETNLAPIREVSGDRSTDQAAEAAPDTSGG
jgi:hypothetical protein